MHNGLLRFTGEKMSKSVGNVATIQERDRGLGERRPRSLFLMTGHWRKPLEFSPETMTAARIQVESFRNALRGETRTSGDWERLAAVLDEDFNTPAALAVLHQWAREGALAELHAWARDLRARFARRHGRGARPSSSSSRGRGWTLASRKGLRGVGSPA